MHLILDEQSEDCLASNFFFHLLIKFSIVVFHNLFSPKIRNIFFIFIITFIIFFIRAKTEEKLQYIFIKIELLINSFQIHCTNYKFYQIFENNLILILLYYVFFFWNVRNGMFEFIIEL